MPMVSGSNGSYSVFGRENTAIYINRRRITDMSELARIQSKDIATIEVINSIYLSNGGMLGGQLSYSKSTDKYGGRSESEMLKNDTQFENLTSDIFSHSNYHQWLGNVYYESKLSKHLGVNFNADYHHAHIS
jgi:hypothetical protein